MTTIDDVWAQIPDAHCKGLCQDACGPAPAGLAERERIWERHGVALPDPFGGSLVGTCPLLVDDRCSVYEDRPTICRLFASAEGLPCPHGMPAHVRADLGRRGAANPHRVTGGDGMTITHERTEITMWGEWTIAVAPMIFNARLVMSHQDDPYGYTYGWCYANLVEAVLAAGAWDPDVEDEPAGWHKRPTGPRLAPNRPDGQVLRCDHGHWPDGTCEYVGCAHWTPGDTEAKD